MEPPILSVSEVSMHFGGLQALFDLSFDVQEGQAIGLMGPNGAGKSTLMNIISGGYKPSSGTIKFKQHNITAMDPYKICHLGIARTFQIPQPFLDLTVLQNLIVAAEYGRGLGKTMAESEANKILEMVDLCDKEDTYARDLNSITLKRLELARALATQPTLLLLDEVASGLTEKEIPRVLQILRRIRDMGITYIMIEHVMRFMKKSVDKIIVIDKGIKIAEGLSSEVMKNSRVIEAYLGKSMLKT